MWPDYATWASYELIKWSFASHLPSNLFYLQYIFANKVKVLFPFRCHALNNVAILLSIPKGSRRGRSPPWAVNRQYKVNYHKFPEPGKTVHMQTERQSDVPKERYSNLTEDSVRCGLAGWQRMGQQSEMKGVPAEGTQSEVEFLPISYIAWEIWISTATCLRSSASFIPAVI